MDTFETAEVKTGSDQGVRQQAGLEFFNHENTIRVNRQKQTPIFVVQGNPPYNTNQADENDNNKNRKYPAIDGRIAATYAADSKATLRRDREQSERRDQQTKPGFHRKTSKT